MKVNKKVAIIVVKAEDEAPEPEKVFKVRPKRKPITQRWFTPLPMEKTISIEDLNPDQEYAFSRYLPDNGGYRTVTASGAAIQRSWKTCFKRWRNEVKANMKIKEALDRFIAAYFLRPPHSIKVNEPIGRWREVVLHPRKDLYFMVQPVDRKHYAHSRLA